MPPPRLLNGPRARGRYPRGDVAAARPGACGDGALATSASSRRGTAAYDPAVFYVLGSSRLYINAPSKCL